MYINRWKLLKVVRDNPGISPKEMGKILGIGAPTVLRHARKHTQIVVERGQRGRGKETKLWFKHDLPAHLQEVPREGEPRFVRLAKYLPIDDL